MAEQDLGRTSSDTTPLRMAPPKGMRPVPDEAPGNSQGASTREARWRRPNARGALKSSLRRCILRSPTAVRVHISPRARRPIS
jgi:hypothetical protein